LTAATAPLTPSPTEDKQQNSPFLHKNGHSSGHGNRKQQKRLSRIGSLPYKCVALLKEFVMLIMAALLKSRFSTYLLFLGVATLFLMCEWLTIQHNNHDAADAWHMTDYMGSSQFFSPLFYGNTDLNDEDNDGDGSAVAADAGNDDAYPSFLDGPTNSSNPYRKKKEGVFFSNVSYDYRDCTSPESHVPWPLEGTVSSKTSSLTCGMRSSTPFSQFFRGTLWKKTLRPLTEHCRGLVVFGVAFGGDFVTDLDAPHVHKLVNATDLLQRHGRCFFIFTLQEDIARNQDRLANSSSTIVIPTNSSRNSSHQQPTADDEEDDPSELIMIGHNILIPIPKKILPYRNPRRNVKLLKYMGQFMFRQTDYVVWQDAKFFRDDFVSKQPKDYHSVVSDACVTTMGLPVHKGTVGLENIREGILQNGRYRPQYEHHCQAIIAALIDRPNVTDSASNLIRQCDAYLQHVYLQEGNTETMNQGLIDSAFIVWNQKTPQCRDFNSALRCTIMDQIQCHSDRDQVSIPFALYSMGLSGMYSLHAHEEPQPADPLWDPRIHDLDFVLSQDENKRLGSPITTETSKDIMVRVVRSSCHWYFSSLGDCRTGLNEDKPSLAIMVAGAAKRFMFTGLVDHVIKPLVQKEDTQVDYYLMLSVKQGLAYRTDEAYMRLQTFDPTFQSMASVKDANKVTLYMYDKIKDNITHSGANIGGIHIQPAPMKLDPPNLRKKQLEAKRARPKEDSYYRFPTLDLRPENRRRTAVTNRNIFKLYLGIQKLWEKHLISSEHYMGVRYDYVMFLREDAMWLDDFSLKKLIATNPNADAYIPSCDMDNPPLQSLSFCDHGIVIKREKAWVIGRYFEQLLDSDLNQCHKSVVGLAPNNTGCNTGMLFQWILEQNNVYVQKVPQSLMPFERSMVIAYKDGATEICIHKYCQSKIRPLAVPKDLRICKNITIPL
jgi:hypothetical protein